MKLEPKAKLCLALIHNEDPNRLKHIRPMLEDLKKKLSVEFGVELFEVFKQPKKIHQKTYLTLFTKFLYWKINREWMSYRKLKPRIFLLDLLILVIRLTLIFTNKYKSSQRFAIESYIADKHIRAWTQFLDRKADVLICFEDDAFFKRDSILNLKKLLSQIKIKSKKIPMYLDLAGGVSYELLNVKKLLIRNDKLGNYYKKPITNTACCYMINNFTANIFSSALIDKPWLRLICADWLMNKMFILSAADHKYFCCHANPHIFYHGSMTGDYSSLYNNL